MSNIIRPEDAWLGLDTSDLDIANPLLNRTEKDIRRPDLHLLRLMRDPKYLGYAANILLNIELLPIQVAVLRELWTRPFPMFVASRGFGKSWLMSVYAMPACEVCRCPFFLY